MAKSKKHFDQKQKQKKIKVSDKVSSFLFCEIITALLDKYHASDEKETMSFEEYCARLRDLSIEKTKNPRGKEINDG